MFHHTHLTRCQVVPCPWLVDPHRWPWGLRHRALSRQATVAAKKNSLPSGRKPAGPLSGCQYRDLSVGFTCPGTCYHSFAATYYESTAAAAVKGSTQRPYSYLVITREEDGAQFTAYGFQNDPLPVIPAKASVRRWISATLEAGFTYRVRVVAPPSNPTFYPDRIAVQLRDMGGCEGRVKVLMEPKDAATNWVATYSPPTSPRTLPPTGSPPTVLPPGAPLASLTSPLPGGESLPGAAEGRGEV
ncbi:unnamed protein product [Closterium sp. NIES-53]